MIYKFTNKAKKVIEIANDISIELGHNYIGTEHILKAQLLIIGKPVLSNPIRPMPTWYIRNKIIIPITQNDIARQSIGYVGILKKVVPH